MKLIGEHIHLRQPNLRVFEMGLEPEEVTMSPDAWRELAVKVVGVQFPRQRVSLRSVNKRDNRIVVGIWENSSQPIGMSSQKFRTIMPGDEKPEVFQKGVRAVPKKKQRSVKVIKRKPTPITPKPRKPKKTKGWARRLIGWLNEIL